MIPASLGRWLFFIKFLYEEVWINIQILCLYSWPIWYLKQLFYKLRPLDTDELTRITIYSTSRFVEKKAYNIVQSCQLFYWKERPGGEKWPYWMDMKWLKFNGCLTNHTGYRRIGKTYDKLWFYRRCLYVLDTSWL